MGNRNPGKQVCLGVAKVTPEYQLVLEASRTKLSQRNRDALVELIGRGPDWASVVQFAEWHQVGGHLGINLQELRSGSEVPAEILQRSWRVAEENRVRWTFFVEPELKQILAAHQGEGIRVIALKGAALQGSVYQNLGFRPIGDLDLMVEEAHLARSRELLENLGYRQARTSNAVENPTDNYHYCPRLLSSDGSIEIELHRHIVRSSSPLFFDIQQFWDSAPESVIAGEGAWVLSPADLVAHLCLSFFLDRRLRTHSYGAFRQLADIVEAVRFQAAEIDWTEFVHQASARSHAGPIFCALWTGRDLLGLDLPPEVLPALRPSWVDDQQLRLFSDRKVLDLDPWFLHELVEPADSTSWNMAKSSLRRLLPQKKFLEEKYWDQAGVSSLGGLYVQHLGDFARTFATTPTKARVFKQHLAADRWMHRLLTEP